MEGEAPDKMDKSEIKESPAPPAAAMELSGPFSGAISIGGAAEAGRHENELDVRRGQVVELWARLKECDAKRKSYKEQAAATASKLQDSEARVQSLVEHCNELENLLISLQRHDLRWDEASNCNRTHDEKQEAGHSPQRPHTIVDEQGSGGQKVREDAAKEDLEALLDGHADTFATRAHVKNAEVARAVSQVESLKGALVELREHTAKALAEKDREIGELTAKLQAKELGMSALSEEDEAALETIKECVRTANDSFESLTKRWSSPLKPLLSPPRHVRPPHSPGGSRSGDSPHGNKAADTENPANGLPDVAFSVRGNSPVRGAGSSAPHSASKEERWAVDLPSSGAPVQPRGQGRG